MDDLESSSSALQSQPTRTSGTSRTTGRPHGRTLDLLMGRLEHARGGDRALLFVCEMCFKYMTDGAAYEAHIVRLPSSLRAALSVRVEMLSSQTSTWEESLSERS
jgi:hypothetical protein